MNPNEMLIQASAPEEMLSCIYRFYPLLERLDRRRVSSVTLAIAMESRDDELFKRYNGKTIADIIEDSRDPAERLIDEGNRDGISYQLFDATPDLDG